MSSELAWDCLRHRKPKLNEQVQSAWCSPI